MHTSVACLRFPSLLVLILVWLCALSCNHVKFRIESNDDYQLWYNTFYFGTCNCFNAIVVQASSKPKLCKFLLNFSLLSFYAFMIFFLQFQLSWIMNNNQQNKMPIFVLVVGSLVRIFNNSHHYYNVLHMTLIVFLFSNVPFIRVSWGFTSPWFTFLYLSMDFDV